MGRRRKPKPQNSKSQYWRDKNKMSDFSKVLDIKKVKDIVYEAGNQKYVATIYGSIPIKLGVLKNATSVTKVPFEFVKDHKSRVTAGSRMDLLDRDIILDIWRVLGPNNKKFYFCLVGVNVEQVQYEVKECVDLANQLVNIKDNNDCIIFPWRQSILIPSGEMEKDTSKIENMLRIETKSILLQNMCEWMQMITSRKGHYYDLNGGNGSGAIVYNPNDNISADKTNNNHRGTFPHTNPQPRVVQPTVPKPKVYEIQLKSICLQKDKPTVKTQDFKVLQDSVEETW